MKHGTQSVPEEGAPVDSDFQAKCRLASCSDSLHCNWDGEDLLIVIDNKPNGTFYGDYVPTPADGLPDWDKPGKRRKKRRLTRLQALRIVAADTPGYPPLPPGPKPPEPLVYVITLSELFAIRERNRGEEPGSAHPESVTVQP